jgi:predicted ATPase
MQHLGQLSLQGFKSVRAVDGLDLGSLNVLVGGNGAGKSNFVAVFRLLHELLAGRLQLHIM